MIRNLFLCLAAAAAPAAAQQADSGRVYELREVEVAPRVENREEFARALQISYPPQLRDAGVSGTVSLAFVIGADGTASEVRVLQASDSAFIAPTVEAVSLLRFAPAQVAGRPVAVRLEQPVTWRVAVEPEPAVAAGVEVARDTDPEAFELDAVEELPVPRNQGVFARALMRLYPRALRDAGTQGRVTVRFRVERDGRVSRGRILSSSDPAFNDPTLQAVDLLRFTPAKVNGAPVPVWVVLPVEWRVHPRMYATPPVPLGGSSTP